MEHLVQLLHYCARLHLTSSQIDRLTSLIATIDCWDGLSRWAEYHGLSPLVYRHLKAIGTRIPREVLSELRVLSLRHRAYSQARVGTLLDIAAALHAAGIQFVVLKGMALAHMIYPTPEMRTMSDIDLLVVTNEAYYAQGMLEAKGFISPGNPQKLMRVARSHHHLPLLRCHRDGLEVNVEIHHDALSRDIPFSITMENAVAPFREFQFQGRRLLALGHIDMLRHLCHNMLEPSSIIKLRHAVDIAEYANRYVSEIDWERLKARNTFVINTIRCIDCWVTLPEPLRETVAPQIAPAPKGVGNGFPQLSSLIEPSTKQSLTHVLNEVLRPSEWWTHAFYNVPLNKSLLLTRWVRHPVRVLLWLLRRVITILVARFRVFVGQALKDKAHISSR